MKPEHIENDRTDEDGTVHEEKALRNQTSDDHVFGRSIIFLKTDVRQAEGDRDVHAFVVVGAKAGQHITFNTFKLSANDLGVADVKVDSMENAGNATNKYKKAIECVSTMCSEYGAVQNRLEHTQANQSILELLG